jgi:hypothetical protein
MKKTEQQATRRKFITIGASSAAVLLGGSAIADQSSESIPHAQHMQLNENTITHDSVAQMKADSGLKAGDKVYTLGYHSAGDNGDNIYIITDANRRQDNGAEFINLNNNGLKARGLFPGGIIRVEQFGAIGINPSQKDAQLIDNTKAMNDAHATGQVVFYAAKRYGFTRLTIPMGGIVGRGEGTILQSIDDSGQDIITYQGDKDDKMAGQFRDFSLLVESVSQKLTGAGIKLKANSALSSARSQIQNVIIKNIPTAIHIDGSSCYGVKDCYLDAYTSYGIYLSKGNKRSDNQLLSVRDNNIQNNVLVTDQSKAIGIKYCGENCKISTNKINGGLLGIDISPSTSNPVVHITDNAIENQIQNCIRLATTADCLVNDDTQFTQVLISQNRLNTNVKQGAAISVAPEHFTLGDISINNNLIRYHGDENTIAAINIKNSSRFMINNNTINCHNGEGYRGIYINQDCSNGILSANHVILPLNGHTLNLSSTTTLV